MTASRPSATLVGLVREQARIRGDAVAYEFEGRSTSFDRLNHDTNRVANGLLAMKLRKGDRIAYLGKNSDIYFELLLGAAKAGIVMTPVNWRLAGPEVAFVINDCAASVLFVGPEFVNLVRTIRDDLPSVRAFITIEGGSPEWEDFLKWRDAQHDDDPNVAVDRNDVAIQLYTSGTTGKPKGAMLSHRNLLNMVEPDNRAEMPAWNRWSSDDVVLLAMPVFHIGGTQWGVNSLYFGARGIVAREFDAEKVLDYFERSGITKLFMVPSAMQIVVRQPRALRADFSRLTHIFYGASPIPAALLRECIDVFKCSFVQVYGMTETTGVIVALPPEDHVEGSERMGSAGKAIPGVELAVVGPDHKPLPPGEVGEIVTRSGGNMVGYWNLPEATAKAVSSEGWLSTGDAGL